MPFDVREILKQLDAAKPPENGDTPAWLVESWKDREGFATALLTAHAGRGSPPPKSRPGQHYDFFHDLVTRHLDSDRLAFRAHDRLRGWQTLSYRQLYDQASRRATEWAEQGVKPGKKVCLVYGLGTELLISLMAAVRLGACFSLLPPQGLRFVPHRLGTLEPDHIAAEPHQVPLLRGFEKLLLRSRGQAALGHTSHTYEPKEPVGLLFSPLVEAQDQPVPLLADDAWHGAVCDGLLTFSLGPGEHLAAPGYHFLQHQPALLFATLLRGATFLHLELADLKHELDPLFAHPLRALGVCPELRELLLNAPPRNLKNVAHWFRNPEEPLDWQAWRGWVRQCGLGSTPHSTVLIDAAAGGMVLGSPRRVGDIHNEAPPAPGRAWTLKDLNLKGQEAPGDVGVFTLHPEDKKRPPGHVVLSRIRDQYTYAGTRDVRRRGRVYPAAEVAATLEELPFLQGAPLVPVPVGGMLGHTFVLLGFTGAEGLEVATGKAGERQGLIERHIEVQLGPEFIPDRIEFFPLYPRLGKKGIDVKWCRSQYVTGMLFRKSRDPMFQGLTALRGRFLESGGKPGDDGAGAVK